MLIVLGNRSEFMNPKSNQFERLLRWLGTAHVSQDDNHDKYLHGYHHR